MIQEPLQPAPVSPEPSPSGVPSETKGFISALGIFFLELIKIVLLAAVTIGFVRYFLFKPFYVKGKSMEPTFHENEYLIIDKITYRIRALEHKDEVHRGDVIVLVSPVDSKEHYLKRVVGLPNERITISDNKIIIYNTDFPQGMVLEEPYVHVPTAGAVTYTLKDDEYFVLGDNREQSFDSRRFGPIKRDAIVGRAWFRGWPFSRIMIFDDPTYNF